MRPVPTRPGNVHVHHLYVVQLDGAGVRDRVMAFLQQERIATGVHYPTPLHETGAYRGHGDADAFPVASRAQRRILSLPMFPQITAAQQQRVVDALRRALDD